jgi:hypothetical protein
MVEHLSLTSLVAGFLRDLQVGLEPFLGVVQICIARFDLPL